MNVWCVVMLAEGGTVVTPASIKPFLRLLNLTGARPEEIACIRADAFDEAYALGVVFTQARRGRKRSEACESCEGTARRDRRPPSPPTKA